MTTMAEVREAEHEARAQRLRLALAFLKVDETKASPDDLQLAARVQEAAKDGTKFDKALASPKVNELFRRGVIYFTRN